MNEREVPVSKSVPKDKCLVFYHSPPMLQEMASFNVAWALWLHKERYTDIEYLTKFSCKVNYFIDDLPSMPSLLQDQIVHHIKKIRVELMKWAVYHFNKVFQQNRSDKSVLKYCKEIVWKCDNTVNYVETAKRLLLLDTLNDVEKCRLMFVFCFQNEIESLGRKLFDAKKFDKITMQGYPMAWYWSCFILGEVQKVNEREGISLESHMITSYGVDNVNAQEYFWSRLRENEKLDVARKLLYYDGKTQKQAFVLSHLNEQQWNEVIGENGGIYFVQRFANDKEFELAHQVWMHIRDKVTCEQYEQFIMSISYDLYSPICQRTLLAYIWQNSPNRLKRYIIDQKSGSIGLILQRVFSWQDIDLSTQLVIDILTEADPQFRKREISQRNGLGYCCKLVIERKIPIAERITKLCLPNTEEMMKFKEKLFDIFPKRKCHEALFEEGGLEKLDEIFCFFRQNDENINDYFTKLLSSDAVFYQMNAFAITFHSHRLLSNAIDHFVRPASTVRTLKKNIVSSESSIRRFLLWLQDGRFEEVKNCLALYLPEEEDAKEVKSALAKIYQSGPGLGDVFHILDGAEIDQFFQWLLPDDRSISRFKCNLTTGKIVSRMLQFAVFENYDREREDWVLKKIIDLSTLDRFLNWRFETEREVRDFKMASVSLWGKIHAIETLLQEKNLSYLEVITEWFFKDNPERKSIFQMLNRKKKLYDLHYFNVR